MIWLVSFPRSGNTFLRNILFEVYGLRSSTYHLEADYPLDEGFAEFDFIKTHQLPGELDAAGFSTQIPAVYLVRDGRDAMCSIAHHRSDLIAPGSDFEQNLQTAIVAERGSFFGGWSRHVESWSRRADIVIRYEDLVRDPLASVERLRAICDLPEPDASRLPTFESLKFGIPKYGAKREHGVSEEEMREHSRKFFRRGKAGAWQDEMPPRLQELFWSYHGEAMEGLGYAREGGLRPLNPDLDLRLADKLGVAQDKTRDRPYRVLMEADKVVSADNDGVKRYQVELLKAMFPAVDYPGAQWQIDLLFHGNIRPLQAFRQLLFDSFNSVSDRESAEAAVAQLLATPGPEGLEVIRPTLSSGAALRHKLIRLGLRLERGLTGSVPRSWVNFLARHRITLFHRIYEFCRLVLLALAGLAGLLLLPLLGLARAVHSRLHTPAEGSLHGYDLVHIPLKQNFRAVSGYSGPRLITFHDLTHLHFPQHHTRQNVRNAKLGVHYAEASWADVIAVSGATRDDVLAHTAISPARVHVIHEAADPRLFSARVNKDDCLQVRRKYGLDFDCRYIICLSTVEPRKNLGNTIRAFLQLCREHTDLQLKLVIAGKKGWDAEHIYTQAEAAPDLVYFTGFVDDADLAYLYSDALCLSYLSVYEGFGLPPLEAMRCGTPVIFGNNSSLVEVVGCGGLPADPTDIEDIKRQYLAIYRDDALREAKARAALAQANNFSWRQAAAETLQLYREIIDGKS